MAFDHLDFEPTEAVRLLSILDAMPTKHPMLLASKVGTRLLADKINLSKILEKLAMADYSFKYVVETFAGMVEMKPESL